MTERYAIQLKSLNRYNYRGVLYKWKDEASHKRNSYAVSRDLRDHLVGTGFFQDIRTTAPAAVVPEPVAEPEAIKFETKAGPEADPIVSEIDPVPAEQPTAPIVVDDSIETHTAKEPESNDMSRGSITGYGQPKPAKDGIEV